MKNIITLEDGYNGHTMNFFSTPIERDGDLVKLQCAEEGKGYLFAWRHFSEIIQCDCKEMALSGAGGLVMPNSCSNPKCQYFHSGLSVHASESKPEIGKGAAPQKERLPDMYCSRGWSDTCNCVTCNLR